MLAMKTLYRDLTKYPPRFKEGDRVHYVSRGLQSVRDFDAVVCEVVPANGLYETDSIEEHIKCDTYWIEFDIYGNKRKKLVTDEDLFDEEDFKSWKERNYD